MKEDELCSRTERGASENLVTYRMGKTKRAARGLAKKKTRVSVVLALCTMCETQERAHIRCLWWRAACCYARLWAWSALS